MIYVGVMAAGIVRVANELGRGDANAARFSIKVVLSTSACIGVFYLFTINEEIAAAVSSLYLYLAFSVLLNSIQPNLSGIAIGSGRLGLVAYINIVTYYVIGLPIGLLLAYVADWEVKGVWIGMLCGVGAQTLVIGFVTWRTDWDEQVRKTSEHLKKWAVDPSETSEQITNHY